jgi:P2 family phage contractile tail tube protein
MSLASAILKKFNLYIDGRGHAGEIDELQLPSFALVTEEHRAGGMDGPVAIDMGMEQLTASFTLASAIKDSLTRFGITDETTFIARGSLAGLRGTPEPMAVTMRGKVVGLEPGAWSGGQKATWTYNLSLTYIKVEVGGRVLFEIDVPNMIRIIDGVDQLAEHRKNIGLV